jgi:NAD(P)-dependent dehydrogenase (short-subunit alcohol dehydrogenase family)/enamine deaminase RidA (YjgF/YER057c/UK114 family)
MTDPTPGSAASPAATQASVVAPDILENLDARVESAVALLEALVADRGVLAHVPEATRIRLLTAAGQVARPDPRARRRMVRVSRLKERRDIRAADERILAAAGIRKERAKPAFQTPRPGLARGLAAPLATSADATLAESLARTAPDSSHGTGRGPDQLNQPRTCYICKQEYRRPHFFYDSMCPPCAELNWRKRNQSADLSGRIALVTGARVKIGYQAAIMLLRAGARVVVTTRFPRDAAARYAREPDFEAWRERLVIYGLDLRHTPSVDAFAGYLHGRLAGLDFLINNACQTVRRPPGFYAHLMAAEARPICELPAAEEALVADYEALRREHDQARNQARLQAQPRLRPDAAGVHHAAALSQMALLQDDFDRSDTLFPAGQLDADLQQVDRRQQNSWRLTLAEVSAVELIEVHLINAVAPFVLNSRLKPLMLRQPAPDRHIVNVSAMEGQFYRAYKTDRHPHTNMAKAALNMMTRTSAADYIKDGIHMNSVDTGWVTDEDPLELAARKTAEHGFHPPLDIVDGAARICDPIFSGVATGEHVWGQFLKDYQPTDW